MLVSSFVLMVKEETGEEKEEVELVEAEVVGLIRGVVVVRWFLLVHSGVAETLGRVSLAGEWYGL